MYGVCASATMAGGFTFGIHMYMHPTLHIFNKHANPTFILSLLQSRQRLWYIPVSLQLCPTDPSMHRHIWLSLVSSVSSVSSESSVFSMSKHIPCMPHGFLAHSFGSTKIICLCHFTSHVNTSYMYNDVYSK
jgi:hypothetical protein